MRHNEHIANSTNAIARYFSSAAQPLQQETLGEIVIEILQAGGSVNRKAICSKLLQRLERAEGSEEEHHYQALIGLLFSR